MLSFPMKDSFGRFWEAPSNSDPWRVANFRDAATGRFRPPSFVSGRGSGITFI